MKPLMALSLVTFSIAAVAAPARAPTNEQNDRCANEDGKLSDAEAIAACTLIIKLKPKDVLVYGVAYSNRAVAEMSLGQEDKANADIREAHRIDPKDFHANPK
jgi:hypothetical protein